MIERYLSIIEVSQKQSYIFGSNKLSDNVKRSAEIWWLTDPQRIQELLNDPLVFDCTENAVYAGGGHTVLMFDTYDQAVAFNRQYSFLIQVMNPEINLFMFTLPYCSKISAKKMLEHINSTTVRSQEGDEAFAKAVLENGEFPQKECTPSMYLKALVGGLEQKKSLRYSSFHQGSFGVEVMDSNTRNVNASLMSTSAESRGGNEPVPFAARSRYDGSIGTSAELEAVSSRYQHLRRRYKAVEGSSPVPEGYLAATEFENLGGTRGDVNLLAVVHIDGNGMGARCNHFYDKLSEEYLSECESVGETVCWNNFRDSINHFSKAIDDDFKTALKNMFEKVGHSIAAGRLKDLSLRTDPQTKKRYFPIRGIIASGDDICFVTDGRIGIECAAVFLEELGRLTNPADGKAYSASAGVTIIHQKYPFFRAYELAESLCTNAKEFSAGLRMHQLSKYRELHGKEVPVPELLQDNGAGICSIDWHMELGEIGISLDEIRGNYCTKELISGKRGHLEMRPYIVAVTDTIQEKALHPVDIMSIEPHRQYDAFRKQMQKYLSAESSYGDKGEDLHSKLKELRGILKSGPTEARHYIEFHKLKGLIIDNYYGIFKEIGIHENTQSLPLFVATADGLQRSVLFDAAEAIEIYSMM